MSTRITFPHVLNADDNLKTVNIDDNTSAIQNSETFGQYELTGFILHTGTAMGGHYRAYIRSPSDGQWRDFNDSTVTEIEIDKNSPLWSIKSKNSINTHEEALNHIDSYSLNTLVQENVYLLLYNKKELNPSNECADEYERDRRKVPPKLIKEIEEEHQQLETLQKLLEIRGSLIECDILISSDKQEKVNLIISKEKSIGDLKREAIQAFQSLGLLLSATTDPSIARLSRFEGQIGGVRRAAETFGGEKSEAATLTETGLRSDIVDQLFLEMRSEDDAPFVEFNPKDIIFHLFVHKLSPMEGAVSIQTLIEKNVDPSNSIDQASTDTHRLYVVPLGSATVPGRDNATVGDLRCIASTMLPEAVPPERLLLIALSESGPSSSRALPILLSSNESSLKRHYHVYSDDKIIVEVIPSECDILSFSSSVLKHLEDYRKRIRILINNPFFQANERESNSSEAEKTTESEGNNNIKYDTEVSLTVDDTLQTLKEKAAMLFSIPDNVPFHIRRNGNGSQLKDLSQSLRELSFSDFSIAHLQVHFDTQFFGI